MLNPVFCLRLNDETKKKEYGFITHEIEETLSKLGSTNTGMLTNDDTGMYSVHYNDMFVLMEKAMQELQVIFEDAKVEISSLEAEHSSFIAKTSSLQDPNKQLENRLKAIEDKLKL
jgi:uncharacterized coiled-coil DUF342 family protein